MTTTQYESARRPADDDDDEDAYTAIQKPADHDYEVVDAAEPVNKDYLVLTP